MANLPCKAPEGIEDLKGKATGVLGDLKKAKNSLKGELDSLKNQADSAISGATAAVEAEITAIKSALDEAKTAAQKEVDAFKKQLKEAIPELPKVPDLKDEMKSLKDLANDPVAFAKKSLDLESKFGGVADVKSLATKAATGSLDVCGEVPAVKEDGAPSPVVPEKPAEPPAPPVAKPPQTPEVKKTENGRTLEEKNAHRFTRSIILKTIEGMQQTLRKEAKKYKEPNTVDEAELNKLQHKVYWYRINFIEDLIKNIGADIKPEEFPFMEVFASKKPDIDLIGEEWIASKEGFMYKAFTNIFNKNNKGGVLSAPPAGKRTVEEALKLHYDILVEIQEAEKS